MALSDATIRSWATIVSENDYAQELQYPNNSRSDAELLARTLRGEEANLDALACIAQEMLNRKRYRAVLGGDNMEWDIVGGYSVPWASWREVLYATRQFTSLTDGYHGMTANPMEVPSGQTVETYPISDAWREACELANELVTMDTRFQSRISESTLLNDQLFHGPIASSITQLRQIFGLSEGEEFNNGDYRETGFFNGRQRHSILIMDDSVFSNDDGTNGNDICNQFLPKTGVGGNETSIPDQTASDFIDFLKSRVGCGYVLGTSFR